MQKKTQFLRQQILAASFSTIIVSVASAGQDSLGDDGSNASIDGSVIPSGWDVTGAAGLALADGNAESLSYSLQLLASNVSDTNETYLGADYFYGDSQGLETTNALRLFGQHNRLITDRFYYGVGASYLNDEISELDYRFDANAVLGYYLLKNDRMKLSIEAGPGYTWEQQAGIKNDYMSLKFGQKFEYAFSSRSKFWQSLTFTPEASDFDNYLFTAEAGIDTLISSQWSLRTFLRHQEDNTPALGRKSGDTMAMVGLAYALGGFPEPEVPGRRTLKAERKPSPIAAMGWSSTASLGYSLAKGNADSASLTAMFDTAHRSTTDEFFFNASANYGENSGTTSIDNLRAAIQFNHLLGSKYYVGAGTGFLRDDLADLDYRFTPAIVAGIYLMKNDVSTLSLEAGPGYTFEKSAGLTNDYLSVQAAERFVYALSPRCTFNQSLVYNAEAKDMGENFTITAGAYLDTDITDNLALRVAASYVYDNTPAVARERHDTTLTSGIAVSF